MLSCHVKGSFLPTELSKMKLLGYDKCNFIAAEHNIVKILPILRFFRLMEFYLFLIGDWVIKNFDLSVGIRFCYKDMSLKP